MTTTSRKKKQNLLENCQIRALKLFWNSYIWHGLDDLIFYVQWINLHDRYRNGPKFITHVNFNIVDMWVILQNKVDWDCVKTPILQEILRTQNLLRVEHCAFLEVIRFWKSYVCSNQLDVQETSLSFRTVQQNPKSSLWTLDWDWTGFSLSICGIWSFFVLGNTIQTSWPNGATRCDLLVKDTRVPIKFLSWEDPARWNGAIHCERGHTSW